MFIPFHFMGDLLILRHDDPSLKHHHGVSHGKTLFLRMVMAQESTEFVWVIPTSVYTALCGWEGGVGERWLVLCKATVLLLYALLQKSP